MTDTITGDAELEHVKKLNAASEAERERLSDQVLRLQDEARTDRNELTAIIADKHALVRKLAAERDEWIARAVKAEDAAKQCDRVVGRLHAELDRARNANHRQGDQLARQHTEITGLRERVEVAEARAAGRCARCGRTAATHLLIRGHSFVRPQRTGRSNG